MGFKLARIKARLTIKAAAEALGVSRGTINRWESERTLPDASRLPDIAKLYGCTVDELLDKNTPG